MATRAKQKFGWSRWTTDLFTGELPQTHGGTLGEDDAGRAQALPAELARALVPPDTTPNA